MDMSRLRVDELRQGVDVGIEQLLESAVLEYLADYLVLSPQSLQHFLARHILSRPRLLGLCVELQPVEEHFAHLLRAGDVEVESGHGVYLPFEVHQLSGEESARLLQSLRVDHHAGLLHFGQYGQQRHLDVGEELPQALLSEFLLEEVLQADDVRAAVSREQVVQVVAHFGVQEIVCYLGVEHGQVRQTLCLEFLPVGLQVVAYEQSLSVPLRRGRYDDVRRFRNKRTLFRR